MATGDLDSLVFDNRFAEALPVAPSGKRDRRAVAAALERST